MAEHNATTTQSQPTTLQISIHDRSGPYNTSSSRSSSSSSGTSKLTKAAMARRFLLRRRRQAARSPSASTPQNLSQTRQLDCVGSPASVMVHTSIIPSTSSRKHIQDRLSLTNHTKGTVEGADEVTVATCVLCYDEMDMIDAHVHPIVCLNYGCTFNCCSTCTETILDSIPNTDVTDSADTDGTISKLHPKVKCPNCRSDLSRTIYDTALLRLIDRGKHNDHSMSDSAQRPLKIALAEDIGLQYEIDAARKREVQFIEEHQKRSDIIPGITSNTSNSSSSSSFQYNAFDHEIDAWYDYDRTKLIDVTLLCGLENIMTWYEQEKVTRYCTSCQTDQLGMAAKLLYHTRTKLQNQQQQQQQQLDRLVLTAVEGNVPFYESNAVTTTMCQLIEAGKRARCRTRAVSHHPGQHHHYRNLSVGSTTESPSPTMMHRKIPEYYTKLSTQKATQFRKIEHEVRLQTAHMKRYPLPIRLPKYCECRIVIDCNSNENDNVSVSQIVKRLPFRFCNDQWDGTVMDAYTKFVIQRCTTTYDPKKLLHGKNYSGKNLNRPIPTSTFVDNYKVHQRRPYDDINIRNILNIEKYQEASENRDYMDSNTVPTNDDDTRDVYTGTIGSRYCDTGDDDRTVDDYLEHSPQASKHDSPPPPPGSSNNNTTSRVMIASVVNMSVASMIFPGDVVTHINGIELRDYTVDDIIALICSLFDSEAATTKATTTTNNNRLVTPPPPPPPTTSSPMAQTLSLLDGTMNLFTSTSSTSQDTDRSHFLSPPSPKSPVTQHHHQPDRTKDNENNTGRQKVLELKFVLNADVAVAKALHLRAIAIRSQQQ